MYEYVITAGEGVLIEFGIAEWMDEICFRDGEELLVRFCDDDCETGQ